jgi:hypothetical protein
MVMNSKRILFLVFFISLALVSPLWAATYYVDNTLASASDTNAGTSSSAPWRNCPGMGGWSGKATLKPGDVVKFNNAATWTQSGSSSLLKVTGGVTYDGQSWGNGTRATFRMLGNNTSSNRPGVIIFLDDDPAMATVVKGFNIDGNKKLISGITVNWPGATKPTTGAVKRIENCVIHDFGDPGGSTFGLYGIKVGSTGSNVTANVEIIDTVVYNTPRSGITIYDALTTGTHEIKNVLIRGCEVYNSGTGASTHGNGIQLKDKVTGVIVEYNYLHDNEGRGIFLEDGSGRPGPNNVILRYNIITGNDTGGISFAQPASKSADIYGNLIFKSKNTGSGGSGIYFESNLKGSLSVKIYNNTIFQNASGGILVSSAAIFSTFEIKNNIISSLSSQIPLVNNARGQITSHSNNIFYRPGGGTLVMDATSIQSSSLGSWEPTSSASDPLLKNVSNLPSGFIGTYGVNIAPNADGLSLTSNSPVIDMGTSLISAYNGSINSVARPAGAKWDIGAFEYGAQKTLTLSGLTIGGPASVNEGGSGTYIATATWSDGSTSAVTPVWSENSSYATISAGGGLTTTAVTANQTVTVGASYTSGGVTKTAAKSVGIVDVSTTKTLSELAITGPASVNEDSSGTYTTTATWSDGSSTLVTPVWSENSAYATISTGGVLTTTAVTADQTVTVSASYTSGGVTKTAAKSVGIVNFSAEVPSGAVKPMVGTVTTPMRIVSSPDAPGGSYIETATSNSGSAVYNFNIDQPGTYKIVTTVYAAGAGSDSFLVKIDNGPQDIWDMNPTEDPALYNIWRQDEVTARGTGAFNAPQFDPLTVELAAGPHTITFSGREPAARLAYSYFMLVSPADVKPAVKTSVLLFRAESGELTAETMKVVSALDVPSGSYITPTSSTSASAVYDFNIDQPGTYKIVAEVYSVDNASDSFFVKIDNNPEDIWDLNPKSDPALYKVWRQDEVTARGTGAFNAPQFDPLKVQFAAGPHTITISGRELNSRLAYFYLTKVPGDTAIIEAESGKLTAPIQIVADAAASGGAYIATTANDSGSEVYSFNITQPGIYKVIARVYAAGSGSDSFKVKIDDGAEEIWDFNPQEDPALYGVWRQDEVTGRGAGTNDAPQYDPLAVPLAAGSHTITFGGREESARLDKFYLEQIIDGPLIKKIAITQ